MPTPVESRTSFATDLWNRAAAAISGPPPPAPSEPEEAPREPTQAEYDFALSGMAARQVSLAAAVARMDPAGTKLDQVRAAASGPYTVQGTTVTSGIQFRMNKGDEEPPLAAELVAPLRAACARAGVPGAEHELRMGRATPESIVRVTQALINGGQLPPGSSAPLADQIHELQWRFGIGLDCAGYVFHALAAVHGGAPPPGVKRVDLENFRSLPSNPRFSPVPEGTARAGDVMVLAGSGTIADPGHNLVVRSHFIVTDPYAPMFDDSLAARGFVLAAQAPIEAFEVDSSFGTDRNGIVNGGVRRDLLLYDSKRNQWCTCRSTVPKDISIGGVPYGERGFTGCFRPKGTP